MSKRRRSSSSSPDLLNREPSSLNETYDDNLFNNLPCDDVNTTKGSFDMNDEQNSEVEPVSDSSRSLDDYECSRSGSDTECSSSGSETDSITTTSSENEKEADQSLQQQRSNSFNQSFLMDEGSSQMIRLLKDQEEPPATAATSSADDKDMFDSESEDGMNSKIFGKDNGSDDNLSSDEENNALSISHVDDPPIYSGAPLKLSESMTAILTYITKHELDGTEIVDLLNLINLHCKQEENEMKTSLYLFKKYFEGLNSPVIYHYFCSCCFTELTKNDLKCPNINLHPGNTDTSIFVEVPLIPQLQRLYSQEEFYKNLSYKTNRKKQNESNIEDIYDGQLYKELVQSGFFLNSGSLNFSMILNADGIPVFKSSKKSLWPFFFSVLELPPKLRVKKEFTLIGGLWFGNKPMVNIILGKLLPSLKIIRKGFDVTPFGSDKTSTAKGVVLAATSDLPAKAMLLGMHTHSGAYSCHICKIQGESIKIVSKKKKKGKQDNIKKKVQEDGEIENNEENENQKTSSVWVFRYEKDRDLRQQNEMITFGENAQKLLLATGNEKSHVFGVKHPSILFKIMFNTVKGFGIDDLHTLYLGTIKSLVKLWFDAKHGGEPFSIRKYLPVIDKRLSRIRPPNFLERGIRGIEDEFCYWNGNECRTWAHYTSIPVLNGVLPDRLLEHYVELISCMQILLSASISPEEVLSCGKRLEQYVKNFENLYGTRHMSMVVHLLLHLSYVVTNLGPMKTYSCFPYESLNGEFLKMIHGTRYVETQLASGCYLISQLPHKLAALQNKETKDYCFKVLHPSLKLMKNEEVCKQPLIFTVGVYKKLSACQLHFEQLVQEYRHGNSTDISTFLRLKKDRTLFASRSYTRCSKTNSYTCSYVHNNAVHCGTIELFLKISSETPESAKFLAVIEKAKTEVLCIGDKHVPHIKIFQLTGNFITVPVENLRDLLFLVEVNEISYVCDPV